PATKRGTAVQRLIHPAALDALNDLWWRRLPVLGRRASATLADVLADGLYLTAWPTAGALGPPLAFLLGLLLGWWRFAPGATFTFSITVMALMLVVSQLSVSLGVWLWLGYAVGDFFLFHWDTGTSYEKAWERLLYVRVPLLISYALLALLLVL